MKRILLVAVALLCAFSCVSCDISAQLESISNSVYDMAINIGESYLKETTYVPPTPTSSEPPSAEPTDTSTDTSTDTDTDTSTDSSSEEPEEPTKPEVIIPVRNPATMDKILSVNLNFELPNNTTNDYALYNPFYIGRAEATTGEDGVLDNSKINALMFAKARYGMQTLLSAGVDLSSLGEAIANGTSTSDSYAEVAKRACEYYNTYASPFGAGIRRIEIGKNPEKYLNAADYALVLSLAYDGGYGVEEGLGILNTSYKDGKITTGALASPDSFYMVMMMEALMELRGDLEGTVAVSTIATDSFVTSDKTPEAHYLDPRNGLSQMVGVRDASYNHIELFVSAFGYNTLDTQSEYYTTEQRQADYLIRTYLLFSAMGIDGASICQYKDEEGSAYHGFGVLDESGAPKIAQYYLYTFSQIMADYTFDCEVESETQALIYRFKNTEGDMIYAVWNPVNDGSAVSGVELSTGCDAALIALQGDTYTAEGAQSTLTADESGFVTIESVGETPMFVRVENTVVE